LIENLDPSTYLSTVEHANQGSSPRDVVILGAGMAGLVAGYELSRLGHRVRVFEASSRIGGRVHTMSFSENGETLHAEVGAMRIPRKHRFTHHYVEALGLQDRLVPFATVFQNEECFVDLEGRVCRIKDAVRLLSQEWKAPDGYEPSSPYTRSFVTALKILVNAISPFEIREAFEHDLLHGALAHIDRLLAATTFSVPPSEITPRFVVAHLGSLSHVWSPSVATFMCDIALEAASGLSQLEGGMEQLPKALAKRLQGEIYLNQPVSGISIAGARPVVRFEDGHEITAEYVVCTIPFSVLRDLELTGFSDSKLAAIHNLKYHDACKVFLLCKQRFWEGERYGIVGGASVSDQQFRQLYYPLKQPHARGVLLASYVIGDESKEIAKLGKEAVTDHMVGMISKIHPEIAEPGMVEDVISFAWGKQKWARGGCSVTFRGISGDQAGETSVQKLGEMHEATVRPEGGVHFAGEHCSDDRAWIEGAVTSALEQVKAIVRDARGQQPEDELALRRTRQRWTGLAPGCVRNSERIAAWSQESTELLLTRVERTRAKAILDLACGPGDPTLDLARACPEARVVGVDFIAALVEDLRRRAHAAGLRSVEARVADMVALPFRDGEFDTVTCRFGLQPYPDSIKERILKEARRVLCAGGNLIVVDWGPEGHGTIHGFYRPALAAHGVVLEQSGPALELSASELARLFSRVGFRDVQHDYPGLHWQWEGSPESLWRFVIEMAPPVRAALEKAGPSVAKDVGQRVGAQLQQYVLGGRVSLPARNVIVSAVR
jgi:monoamine oxidase